MVSGTQCLRADAGPQGTHRLHIGWAAALLQETGPEGGGRANALPSYFLEAPGFDPYEH